MSTVNATNQVPISQYASQQHKNIKLENGNICVKSSSGATTGTASSSLLDWEIKDALTNEGLLKPGFNLEIIERDGGKSIKITAKKPEANPNSTKTAATASYAKPADDPAYMFGPQFGPSSSPSLPVETSSKEIANKRVLPDVRVKAKIVYRSYIKNNFFTGKVNVSITIGKDGGVENVNATPDEESYVPTEFCKYLEQSLKSMQFGKVFENKETLQIPMNFTPGS